MNYMMFTNNGIGDKLLDLIGFTTYCNIKKLNYSIIFNDIFKKYLFGMENIYNIDLICFNNIKINNNYNHDNKDKILLLDNKFNSNDTDKKIIYDNDPKDYNIPDIIKNKLYPIIYYTPVITFNPVNIFEKLNKEYPLKNIMDIFIEISENIHPSEKIELYIPENIKDCYGIHLRRTDKIISNYNYNIKKNNNKNIWVNSNNEYDIIIEKLKNYILECIKKNIKTNFFICSEDREYKNYFENWIIENNGNIIKIKNIEYNNDESFLPILELFCLSKCKEIIQCTKYSSFSVVASLIGNKKLINFSNEENNLINIFKYMLNFNETPINKNMEYNNIELNKIYDICNNYIKINL